MSNINSYISKNLFGLECAVQDSSYVTYNLYLRKFRQTRNEADAMRAAAAAAARGGGAHSSSSSPTAPHSSSAGNGEDSASEQQSCSPGSTIGRTALPTSAATAVVANAMPPSSPIHHSKATASLTTTTSGTIINQAGSISSGTTVAGGPHADPSSSCLGGTVSSLGDSDGGGGPLQSNILLLSNFVEALVKVEELPLVGGGGVRTWVASSSSSSSAAPSEGGEKGIRKKFRFGASSATAEGEESNNSNTQGSSTAADDAVAVAGQLQEFRASRYRFLRSTFGESLPSAAEKLLDAVATANEVVSAFFNASLGTPQHSASISLAAPTSAVAPINRAAVLHLQSQSREMLKAVRKAREQIEEALNDLNEAGDDDDDDEEGDEEAEGEVSPREMLYQMCLALYEGCLQPRLQVVEALCPGRLALASRTDESLEFAVRAISSTFGVPSGNTVRYFATLSVPAPPSSSSPPSAADRTTADPTRWIRSEVQRLCKGCPRGDSSTLKTVRALRCVVTELPAASVAYLDALLLLHRVTSLLFEWSSGQNDASEQSIGETLDLLCDRLLESGFGDAERFIAERFEKSQQDRTQRLKSARKDQLGESAISGGGGGGGLGRSMSFKQQASSTSNQNNKESNNNNNKGKNNTPNKRRYNNDSDDDDEEDDDDNVRHASSISFLGSSQASPLHRTNSLLSNTAAGLSSTTGGGGSRQPATIANTMRQVGLLVDEALTGSESGSPTTTLAALVAKLYDALGQVNLFLRRNGLAQETKAAKSAGEGKHVPTMQSQDTGDAYLPHQHDASLGFDEESSELYSRACLVLRHISEQSKVQSRLDWLVELNDDDFFRECHAEGDLFQGLMEQADEHCVVSEARSIVAKRVEQLLVVRIKVFHHNGEVRACTISQTASLDTMLKGFEEFWPDLRQVCDLSYVEDEDKVLLSTNREYSDLLRVRRQLALEGVPWSGGMSTLGSSSNKLNPNSSMLLGSSLGNHKASLGMSRTASNGPSVVSSSAALKLELFADPKSNNNIPSKSVTSTTAGGGRSKPYSSTPGQSLDVSTAAAIQAQVAQARAKQSAGGAATKPPGPPSGGTASSPPRGPPPPPRPNIFDSLPPNKSVTEMLRESETPPKVQDGPTMDEIARMYDRKALAMGVHVPSPAAAAGGGNGSSSALPPLPPSDPHVMKYDHCVVYQKPRPAPPPPSTTSMPAPPPPPPLPPTSDGGGSSSPTTTSSNSAVRSLFFAMGKAKRSGDATYQTIDPQEVQQALRSAAAAAGNNNNNNNGQPAGGSKAVNTPLPQGTGSVRILPSKGPTTTAPTTGANQPPQKWSWALPSHPSGAPPPPPTEFPIQFAKHTLDSEDAHLAGTNRSMLASYFDDDEGDDPNSSPPRWNRGSENHVEAVLAGNAMHLPGGGVRYAGVPRRNAVPLPKGAVPPPPKGKK